MAYDISEQSDLIKEMEKIIKNLKIITKTNYQPTGNDLSK